METDRVSPEQVVSAVDRVRHMRNVEFADENAEAVIRLTADNHHLHSLIDQRDEWAVAEDKRLDTAQGEARLAEVEVARLTADNRRLIAERDMAEKKIVQLADKCNELWKHIPNNVKQILGLKKEVE